MTKYITTLSISLVLLTSICSGDVFTNRKTGEVFYGYPTNRTFGKKARIYVEKDGKFTGKTVMIDDYDIKYDPKGRKDNIIVIGLNFQDILVSDAVSEELAKTIEGGANRGPLCILLDIDSPGGRGECMKVVCDAINNTANCPVIAYISGIKYGGAFSAAAGIAIACDKIYIAKDAKIGTVSTPVTSTIGKQDDIDWQQTYTPESISEYAEYLSDFAKKNNRSQAMAMGLLDRNIEIVEVVVDEYKSKNIVIKSDKNPKDAIVKVWSKSTDLTDTNKSEKDDDQEQKIYDITLSAEDAIYTKMADAIVTSRSDVIEDLKFSDAKIIKTNRIRIRLKGYAKSKSVLAKSVLAIDQLEKELEAVDKKFKEVTSAAIKNRPSREDENLKRLQRQLYENQLYYGQGGRKVVRRSLSETRRRPRLSSQEIAELERQVAATYVDPYLMQQQAVALEMAYVLDDLLYYCTQAILTGKKYPGALPKDVTLRSLQLKYNSAAAKRNSLGF